MKLCLNMIVKNEAGRIVRALKSAAPYITCYAITDTGSTDNTVQVITDFFKEQGIPGKVSRCPFVDWSQARNHALTAARLVQTKYGWDYALLMDADMELVVLDKTAFHAWIRNGAPALNMEQRCGTLHYDNARLVSSKATGRYKGVTHEYLDVEAPLTIPHSIAYFADHADGANRPGKFKRDIELLLAGIEKEPTNSRYFFYLAQSYRDAGDLENAKLWYKKRVDAGGWVEEQWNAQVNYACCWRDQGNEAEFIRNMLIAYNMRPSRAETLYDLASHFRLKEDGMQNVAGLFAGAGLDIPRSPDSLFVNDFVYTSGIKEEFAISGYYNERTREKAFDVCDKLSLQPGPYSGPRETSRSNMYWYLHPLKDYCPSFESKVIPFKPPENWTTLNPSITNHGHDQRLHCVVRTVNYRIDGHGRYLIRGTDGTANGENPINTRNFLLDLGYDPMRLAPLSTTELLPPGNMPVEWPLVIGFEDMRLFSWDDDLWTSSTVRQLHKDGNCEQVLARLDGDRIVNFKRMLREPRETEKNWAPIPNATKPNELLFMWRPGTTIDRNGQFVHKSDPGLTTDILSGGTQLVPYGPFPSLDVDHYGWLALVHTAHILPNSPCRYYYHRWIAYDTHFKVIGLSKPFYFHDKQIEFAAGLARHPEQTQKLVISYGVKDAEARIATIDEREVARMLWPEFRS